jgi:aminoglycoside phosphotransferase
MSAAEVAACRADNKHVFIKSIDVKYAHTTYSVKREQQVVRWLRGRLNVPEIYDFGVEQNREYMIMSRLEGIHIDDFQNNPPAYVAHMANAIKLVQSVDISDCAFDSRIATRLSELKWLIDNNLASLDDWEDTTRFSDPYALYQWLCDHKPSEALTFSHGDITANFFVHGFDYFFYDWGRAGVADKWMDIAFCVKTIREFEDKGYEDRFFERLNIEPDYEKIDYFILLDEMF